MKITSLLSSGNWVFAHKYIIKKFNSDAALIVGLFSSQQELSETGWFYKTFEQIEEELGIKLHSCRKAINMLIDGGFLNIKRKGLPCKTYYKLDEDALIELFTNDEETNKDKSYRKHKDKSYRKHKDIKRKYKLIRTKKKIKKEKTFLDYFENNWKKDEIFQNLINQFEQHRKEKGNKLTQIASRNLAIKLKRFDFKTACASIQSSLENGYTGIFEINPNKHQNRKSNNSFGSRNNKLSKSPSTKIIIKKPNFRLLTEQQISDYYEKEKTGTK